MKDNAKEIRVLDAWENVSLNWKFLYHVGMRLQDKYYVTVVESRKSSRDFLIICYPFDVWHPKLSPVYRSVVYFCISLVCLLKQIAKYIFKLQLSIQTEAYVPNLAAVLMLNESKP